MDTSPVGGGSSFSGGGISFALFTVDAQPQPALERGTLAIRRCGALDTWRGSRSHRRNELTGRWPGVVARRAGGTSYLTNKNIFWQMSAI